MISCLGTFSWTISIPTSQRRCGCSSVEQKATIVQTNGRGSFRNLVRRLTQGLHPGCYSSDGLRQSNLRLLLWIDGPVFLQLGKDFPAQNATSLTSEEARVWLNGLINQERTAGTVRGTWLNAAKTIWGWALEQRLVTENPFLGIRLPRQRRTSMRESKAFRAEEATSILSASLGVNDAGRKSAAAKRWIPWLCAYTGARSGEIAQLRGSDVIERDGVRAVRITPDAGTVKSRQTRLVPLHEHLIEQGFLSFVEQSGKGPLFYNERNKGRDSDDPTNPRKPRYVKARELVAAWVRELGVDDCELQPNHAWRHTFKHWMKRGVVRATISLARPFDLSRRCRFDRRDIPRGALVNWPAPGSEDTELGVLMEPEVRHGETEVYAGVQA